MAKEGKDGALGLDSGTDLMVMASVTNRNCMMALLTSRVSGLVELAARSPNGRAHGYKEDQIDKVNLTCQSSFQLGQALLELSLPDDDPFLQLVQVGLG